MKLKKYKPTQSFLSFIDDFVLKCKKLSTGIYTSDDGKHTIQYVGKEDVLRTVGITHGGRIKINRAFVLNKKITANYLFFLIIWVDAFRKSNDFYSTDLLAVDYYLTTKRLKRDLLLGFLQTIRTKPSADMKLRYEYICKRMGVSIDRKPQAKKVVPKKAQSKTPKKPIKKNHPKKKKK